MARAGARLVHLSYLLRDNLHSQILPGGCGDQQAVWVPTAGALAIREPSVGPLPTPRGREYSQVVSEVPGLLRALI